MTEANTPPSPPAAAPARPIDDEISLWEVLAVLLRRRGTIVRTTVLVTVVAIAVAQFRPLTYTTSAAFRPQGSEQSASQLMSLASQFGVSVPGGGDEASPAFYAELLTSREMLYEVVGTPIARTGEGSLLLKDLLEIEEETEERRDEATYEWLRDEAVSVSTGRETGTVTLSVKTEWPEVSLTIANLLLEGVARFNLVTRQSQAAAEGAFIEGRVEQARADLEAAEDSLRIFLEENRQWENAPLLRFRLEAMQREVGLRSSVMTTLVQSSIQARIAEVRDTPVITVLQQPYFPPRNDPRRRVLTAALGLVLGGMLGIVMAFLVEAFRRPNPADPARADFERTWQGFRRSIPFLGGGRV
jgi:uncharacterized protein involved in exopolysaccharide biosynthesis